ncbi:hemoglobin subunit beta-A-like [Solea solea]|uniref:hemoglobin subunit beta-A-like n=1 Tax=Solea solea TaxID=90069 RepID=UPI00272BA1F2|nr:hemoglobin subunit beta-A-like [Solea solea]
MVEWTDKERAAIKSVWDSIDAKKDGAQALIRVLIVYPWTKRYFKEFGDLSTNAAIAANAKVSAHGARVLSELEKAVNNLDDIKNTYAKLSVIHSERLHVDPDNFRLLAECITVVLGAKFGPSVFTPDIQEAWQKFLSVVVSALGRQYH